MRSLSKDDCSLQRDNHYKENVDYMGDDCISNFHLFTCWKENNSISVKSLSDDICSKIPSTVSKRLENISWRRWDKQIWGLKEISPAQINWNKSQDVTWLYGPKYTQQDPFEGEESHGCGLTQRNLSILSNTSDLPELMADELSSEGSSSCDDITSLGNDREHSGLKSVLKVRSSPFASANRSRKKSVKFNYIVNSREFLSGLSFDYDFLDTSCF